MYALFILFICLLLLLLFVCFYINFCKHCDHVLFKSQCIKGQNRKWCTRITHNLRDTLECVWKTSNVTYYCLSDYQVSSFFPPDESLFGYVSSHVPRHPFSLLSKQDAKKLSTNVYELCKRRRSGFRTSRLHSTLS